MDAQLNLQLFLRDQYLKLRAKNPSYSMRAFATKVGLSSSALSEVLRGRRRLSRKMAVRIADRLLLDPHERHCLLTPFEMKGLKGVTDSHSKSTIKLRVDQFEVIADWVHYAILSLVKTSNFKPSITWMAERLGVPPKKIAEAINRLTHLGLLDTSASWVPTYSSVHTTDDIANLSLRKAHLVDLDLAKTALQEVAVEFRDFTSISMPTNPKLLPKAKETIRRFREELTELLESEPGTEVYQMNIALYPLTKIKDNRA